jgi:hypothetical protein
MPKLRNEVVGSALVNDSSMDVTGRVLLVFVMEAHIVGRMS